MRHQTSLLIDERYQFDCAKGREWITRPASFEQA